MTPENAPPRTAAELCRLNSELDETLLRLLTSGISTAAMPTSAEGEWSMLQVAAHLAEFPHYFAADLRRWQFDRSAVVGRTHDHPARLAAVAEAHASQSGLQTLNTRAYDAFEDLAQALSGLTDEDLSAATINVKYGEEPLRAFLDRYVVEHKRGHITQLERLVTDA